MIGPGSPLTDRQAAIFDYLAERLAHGESPTLREIGAHFGIASTNGVNDHLVALERRGVIYRLSSGRHAIRIASNAPPFAARKIRAAVEGLPRDEAIRVLGEAIRALEGERATPSEAHA